MLVILFILCPGLGRQASFAKAVKQPSSKGLMQDDPGCRGCVSQAASLFAQGKNLEASLLLQEWTARCVHNSQLHLLLSTILLRLGRHGEEAEAEAGRAVTADPNSIAAHLQLALVLMSNSNNVRAAQEFERVTELDPSSYEAWSSLSSLYGALNETDKATKCASKAADLEPGTRAVRLRMLKNLQRTGKIEEATSELKRLVSNSDFGPEIMQQLSQEAMSMGAYDEAIEATTRVIEAYPKSLPALKTRVLAQLAKHDFDEGLKTAQKMIVIDPNNAESHALTGLTLVRLGRNDEAEKELKIALGHQGELPTALLGMGSLQFARGEYEAASQALEHALEQDPTFARDANSLYILAQSLDKIGEGELAINYYKQGLAHGLSGLDADQAKQSLERLKSQSASPSKRPSKFSVE